jgi:hypothetical protein
MPRDPANAPQLHLGLARYLLDFGQSGCQRDVMD